MSVEIQFEIEGETQLAAVLGATANGIKDWGRPLARISTEMLKSFDMNFTSNGGLFQPGGWAARKRRYPWPLLEKTGHLRGAFRARQTTDAVAFSNEVTYFKYHQSSEPRTSALPRRILMKIDEERRRFIIRQFQQHIVEAGRGLIDRG